ncbi:hypothetical protein [Paraburkholderia oxyphila]|uniref:hypothetical protein n=1 Tax=Paraburkholderia oxyphila TaxID=614212 RepID=UPI002ADE2433|nr:hypothetical protein [Paraburkholderia oxyphila]
MRSTVKWINLVSLTTSGSSLRASGGGAFGWKSALPIQRLGEALAEIWRVARVDPVLADDGAVSRLESFRWRSST